MKERWRFSLIAELETAFHTLGPGRTLPLIDRALQVDVQGNPMIPASSVRGRIRAHLERLLRATKHPVCCPPRPERMCPHAGVVTDVEDPYCLACHIFGSPWRDSAVFFQDLHLVDAARGSETVLAQRVGVGINRWLGSAQEQRLYFTETTSGGGLRFSGDGEGWLTREEMGWFLAALSMVRHLGGDKARGLGRVRLSVENLARWSEADGQWVLQDPKELLGEVIADATS